MGLLNILNLRTTRVEYDDGGATGYIGSGGSKGSGSGLGLGGMMDWNRDGDPFDEIKTVAGIGAALTAPLMLVPGLQGAGALGTAGFGAIAVTADWLDNTWEQRSQKGPEK